MKRERSNCGRFIPSLAEHGQSADSKELIMKKRIKSRSSPLPDHYTTPEEWRRLLNIGIALMVVALFGAIFTGCSMEADESNEEVVCFIETPNSMICKFAQVNDVAGIATSSRDIHETNLDSTDKIVEPESNSEIDEENRAIAGINFGNIPINFGGGVPFALFGLMAPEIAIGRRRRDTVLFSRVNPKDLQFLGLSLIAAMFGVIMLASGFAIAISLTPLLAVGGTILLMTAKKPELAFAASSNHDDASDGCRGVPEVDPRRAQLFEKHFKNCLRSFRIVANKRPARIEAMKKKLEGLCFLTPGVVEKAYNEVFRGV